MQYTIFFLLMFVIFAIFGFNIEAEILFHDDFERLEIGRTKWIPLGSWGLEENDTRHNVLGRRVLDVWGRWRRINAYRFPRRI